MATGARAPQAGSFLSMLTDAETSALRGRGAARKFRRGSILFHAGESSDRVIVVLAGRIKVSYYTEDGREVVLAVREPGDIIGELSALDGEPRSASATALDPVEVLSLSALDFRSFLEQYPRVALLLLEMLSRRLRDADRKRIEFGAFETTGRVARRLVELAERFGEDAAVGVRITLPLTQDELAGWVGSSREAVSKALRSLRDRGWIETHRRGIIVLDVDALRRRAT